ncbi:DoxX family protein [Rhodococcus sp. JVH1]|uniref:DoxX family protein n=1 Tax=Rhodococcus sp. JVH1 TaxID=745408 RepID=UPI000271F438|nr:DoxX family protein [Rhodococcus sp. JVH1]EJI97883.1 invasion protein [Rhodococcus sp. JVH1]
MTTINMLAGGLAVTFGAIGAKIAAVAPMRQRAAHLGFTVPAYRRIGALEAAGALGLLAGWAMPGLGAAAAGGLSLLLTGALAAHLRNGDTAKDLVPAVVLGIGSAAYLGLYAIEATS